MPEARPDFVTVFTPDDLLELISDEVTSKLGKLHVRELQSPDRSVDAFDFSHLYNQEIIRSWFSYLVSGLLASEKDASYAVFRTGQEKAEKEDMLCVEGLPWSRLFGNSSDDDIKQVVWQTDYETIEKYTILVLLKRSVEGNGTRLLEVSLPPWLLPEDLLFALP